ncbi:uncharacterized protein SOCE26_055920 [Sorangium cellulosum]|uniref:Uncharacterized protein n=1 Tax=Sorangium cellulosum TaxID=56 RepID=A0A2L0EXV9_SORCE|nr:hypothetical protein [Sorangium cellulosum]AUX44130.1 uncharacterized protein SOCE26_055920 [Sorangium cellulosum]
MTSLLTRRLGHLLPLTIFLAALAGGGRDARADPVAVHARSSGAAQPLPAGTPAPQAAAPQAAAPQAAAPTTTAAPQAGGPVLAPVAGPSLSAPAAAVPAPPAGPPQTRLKSRGMVVGGVALTGVGAVSTLLGAALILSCSKNDPCDPNREPNSYYINQGEPVPDTGYGSIGKTIGLGLVVLGVASMGGGIVLATLGSRRVPVPPEERAASRRPEIVLGVRYAGLRWSM